MFKHAADDALSLAFWQCLDPQILEAVRLAGSTIASSGISVVSFHLGFLRFRE